MYSIQVPLSFVGYLQLGVDRTSLGLRVTSMGLSFLLLCEIMTIKEQAREQQALRAAAKRPYVDGYNIYTERETEI